MAAITGNLNNIAAPLDNTRNICGRNNINSTPPKDLTDYPYLYINPKDISLNVNEAFKHRVCVKECVKAGIQPECANVDKADCIMPEYDTQAYFGRFCLPTDYDLAQKVISLFQFIGIEKYWEVCLHQWWFILIGAIVAVGLSLLIVGMMHCCAPIIVWLMVMLVVAGLGGLGYFCLDQSREFKYQYNHFSGLDFHQKDALKDKSDWYWWGMLGCWIMDAIVVVVLAFICNSIIIATKMLSNAADFIDDVKQVIFVPMIYSVIFVLWVGIWVVGSAF